MTLLAGFDLIAEISNSAVLDLIKTQFRIQGDTTATPPFEFDISLTPLNATVHVIVTDILLDLLDLGDDDAMSLTMKFHNSSVIGSFPPITVSALEGDLTVTAPIQLTGGLTRALAIEFSTADVSMTYISSDNHIEQGLAGSGITVQAFKKALNDGVKGFFHGKGLTPFGVGFRVVPGFNGTISPTLIFERLEVQCIGDPDRTKQALAFCGILLAANDANGDPTLKTSTAIASGPSAFGPREVAVSFSPPIFHQMFFCPAVTARAFPMPPPPPCGNGFLVKDGATVTMLFDYFGAGHVNIDGLFTESGFCYEANGFFHGELTFTVSGTTLTPSLQWDEPEIDVDTDIACWHAGVITLGLETLISAAIVDDIAEDIAAGIGGDVINQALGSALPQSNVGGFGGVSYDLVTVTPEGMTLHGVIMPLGVVSAAPGVPAVQLEGSVATTSTQTVSSGTYHYPGILSICEAKDFPYEQVAQYQAGTYQVIPELMGLPFAVEWRIDGKLLVGSSGTLSIVKHCQYPFPPESRGTAFDQEVHINYTVGVDSIQLKNLPDEGNYYFMLSARATDPLGQSAEQSVSVTVEGEMLIFGGGYEDYVNECHKALRDLVRRETDDFTATRKPIPRWVRVDKPPPEKVFDLVYELAASSKPAVKALVAQTITAHRSAFMQAVFAARAGDLRSVKGKLRGPSQ